MTLGKLVHLHRLEQLEKECEAFASLEHLELTTIDGATHITWQVRPSREGIAFSDHLITLCDALADCAAATFAENAIYINVWYCGTSAFALMKYMPGAETTRGSRYHIVEDKELPHNEMVGSHTK